MSELFITIEASIDNIHEQITQLEEREQVIREQSTKLRPEIVPEIGTERPIESPNVHHPERLVDRPVDQLQAQSHQAGFAALQTAVNGSGSPQAGASGAMAPNNSGARQPLPSKETAGGNNNPTFQLMSIPSTDEQVIVQRALLNNIIQMFNQLAAGNFPGQKTNESSRNTDNNKNDDGDGPQVGDRTGISTLIDAVNRQSTEAARLQTEAKQVEDAVSKVTKAVTTVSDDLQHPKVELKLDKIQLPTFDGDLTNWIAFRDQYLDLVHNNAKLTTVTKFYQLKTHLKGLALDSINGFKLSAADYEAAWFVLMRRYNKPDQIIEEYFRKFESLPALTHAHTVGIIRMVNAVNQLIRVLPNLGVDVTTWDKWIMFNLKSRLDKVTLRKWMDQVKLRQDVKLQEMLEFLEVEAAECLSSEPEKMRPTISKWSQKRNRKQFNRSATTMLITEAIKCAQCNNGHQLFQCATFKALPTAERIKKVKASKLCIKCLKEHQHPADCKFGACPTCTKEHNSLLCLKREQLKKSNEQSEKPVVA